MLRSNMRVWKSHIVWLCTAIEFEFTSKPLKNYVLYRINMCSTNEIRTYSLHLPCCHYHVTYQHQLCCFTFINPLPWPHGMVKGPSNVHFRISAEVLGTFSTRPTVFFNTIWTYYSFGILLYCMVGKYLILDAIIWSDICINKHLNRIT